MLTIKLLTDDVSPCRSLERDLERSRADHISEIENLTEKHRQSISENKKKQWVSS